MLLMHACYACRRVQRTSETIDEATGESYGVRLLTDAVHNCKRMRKKLHVI